MVHVMSNDGETAVLREEDGTLVYRHRALTNEKCRQAGLVEIARDVWLKIWPVGQDLPPDYFAKDENAN